MTTTARPLIATRVQRESQSSTAAQIDEAQDTQQKGRSLEKVSPELMPLGAGDRSGQASTMESKST
jgi:hypothetical protein